MQGRIFTQAPVKKVRNILVRALNHDSLVAAMILSKTRQAVARVGILDV